MRQWAIKILAIVLPVVLFLAGIEGAMRWHRYAKTERLLAHSQFWNATVAVHKASRDPALIYELVPGSEAIREGVHIRINSAGFRDDEFPRDLKGPARRIVVLGDSVAWGWGVPMDRAFPQRLEQILADRAGGSGASTVVFNLSVDGYSTDQEIRLLETRGMALHPDLVVLDYVLNDPDVVDGGQARHYAKPGLELARWLAEAYRKLYMRFGPYEGGPEYHYFVHSFFHDRIRQNFRRLGELSQRLGVPILVAVSPLFEFGPDGAYPWQRIVDDIHELCTANGLQFLDLYQGFRGKRGQDYAFDAWHPKAAGHEIMARELADYIEPVRKGPTSVVHGVGRRPSRGRP